MPLYIILCEDHARNCVIVGNEQGAPYQSKEQAVNAAKDLKNQMPLREFAAMEIVGLRIQDPTRPITTPTKVKLI